MKVMLRDKKGRPYEAECVRMVELPGLKAYRFALTIPALTIPEEGSYVFTVSELSTGCALAAGIGEAAIRAARATLRHRGNAAFKAKVAELQKKFGPLPIIGSSK